MKANIRVHHEKIVALDTIERSIVIFAKPERFRIARDDQIEALESSERRLILRNVQRNDNGNIKQTTLVKVTQQTRDKG
jgi:hypothetical protein